jgi:hypothetical protein
MEIHGFARVSTGFLSDMFYKHFRLIHAFLYLSSLDKP